MTEIEKLKLEIKVIEEKLFLLEKLSQTKSPVEEAFKRVYGRYPITDINDTCWDGDEFFKGYTAAMEDYKVEEHKEPVKKKSLYQFLVEWKYGIDDDEFSVLDWSQIFIEYLYEWGDIISEDKDEIVIKLKQTQLEIAND